MYNDPNPNNLLRPKFPRGNSRALCHTLVLLILIIDSTSYYHPWNIPMTYTVIYARITIMWFVLGEVSLRGWQLPFPSFLPIRKHLKLWTLIQRRLFSSRRECITKEEEEAAALIENDSHQLQAFHYVPFELPAMAATWRNPVTPFALSCPTFQVL